MLFVTLKTKITLKSLGIQIAWAWICSPPGREIVLFPELAVTNFEGWLWPFLCLSFQFLSESDAGIQQHRFCCQMIEERYSARETLEVSSGVGWGGERARERKKNAISGGAVVILQRLLLEIKLEARSASPLWHSPQQAVSTSKKCHT